MYSNTIHQLLTLTKPYCGRPDLIQGPGGNTSVKAEDGSMFIKASGFLFSEMSLDMGISAVDANVISRYFHNVTVSDKAVAEKESLEIISASILKDERGSLYPKPSMETGFHAVLDTYVVHTHSVWTNLLNCNKNKAIYFERLKDVLPFHLCRIPYVSPGFGLSYLITQALKTSEPRPSVFFLENHGVIAHGDDAETVHELLRKTDEAIAAMFQLSLSDYPDTSLKGTTEGFIPVSDFCTNVLKKHNAGPSFFDAVLFPDQTVFFKGNIGSIKDACKIGMAENHELLYHTEEREAVSMHETMTSYLFLYDAILSKGDMLQEIEGKEIDYIQNMDMEKHRKSIMNKKDEL
jgi:ribulose-5-phosphate 4-epimerase/fuculose-1-phosphate aldolase